jgi:hypothetical protein
MALKMTFCGKMLKMKTMSDCEDNNGEEQSENEKPE